MESESCAKLFKCVHGYYMRVYDVLSAACSKCYEPAFPNSGKLANFEKRLTELADKFDNKPRCAEGCTTDSIDYLMDLHETFVEDNAASKFLYIISSIRPQ